MTTPQSASSTVVECEARAAPSKLLDLLAGRAKMARGFSHFLNSFHEAGYLDARLLELCRARIDVLHGVEGRSSLDAETALLITQGNFASLSIIEQQALSVTEQLAIDAHGVTDAQVAGLNAALGEAATVSLLTAVSMHDAAIRLQKVLQPLADTQSQSGGAH